MQHISQWKEELTRWWRRENRYKYSTKEQELRIDIALDAWLSKFDTLLHKAITEEREKWIEALADTTVEAQLKFWQKASDFQKGLLMNLKERGIDVPLSNE